jgi:hypothetical protein
MIMKLKAEARAQGGCRAVEKKTDLYFKPVHTGKHTSEEILCTVKLVKSRISAGILFVCIFRFLLHRLPVNTFLEEKTKGIDNDKKHFMTP